MPSRTSAQDKKRPQSVTPLKKKLAKSDKTVEVKLDDPSEEDKKARILAAFTTPDEEVLANFRKISTEKRKQAKASSKKTSTTNFLAKPPLKGKKYTIDLRIHTPGTIGYFVSGGINPGPALGRLAKVKGLDIIGLTNFYDPTLSDKVLEKVGEVCVLPGVDLRCSINGCDEVYFTVLFREGTKSEVIQAALGELEVPQSARGNRGFLMTQPITDITRVLEKHGGLIIPSRLDKTPNRMRAVAELVEQGFHVFDLIHPESVEYFRERWPDGGFTFLSFSNAGALAQIGTRMSEVKLTSRGFDGLKELCGRRETTDR